MSYRQINTGHVWDDGYLVGSTVDLGVSERCRAARWVASHAKDAQDAASILEALGLSASDGLQKTENAA